MHYIQASPMLTKPVGQLATHVIPSGISKNPGAQSSHAEVDPVHSLHWIPHYQQNPADKMAPLEYSVEQSSH